MIANDLADRINNNEFKETFKIPTEDQLVNEYKVSKNTIRSAIKILVKAGLIYPVQGSGMFVRDKRKYNTVFLSGTRWITKDHPCQKITNKCLLLEIVQADDNLSQIMQCEVGTPIYYIERLRIVDDVPYAVEYTYYNKNIIHYLNKEIVEASIYSFIKEDLNISFGFADKYISSRKLTDKESELLELEKDDPAIVIEDNVYLSNGYLFNSSQIVYNYKLAHFFMTAEYRKKKSNQYTLLLNYFISFTFFNTLEASFPSTIVGWKLFLDFWEVIIQGITLLVSFTIFLSSKVNVCW